MSNSLFSKEAQEQLNNLKKQLKPQSASPNNANSKPDEKVVLPSKVQIQKQIKKINDEKKRLESQLASHSKQNSAEIQNSHTQEMMADVTEDSLLFQQAMAGTQPLKDKNQIRPEALKQQHNKQQLLAKKAAAVGSETNENQPAISDMQALLNPVAENAFLLYKNPTLPNNIFTKLKEGKFRWFEAVDLHGSTIEEAREAVLHIIQLAKEQEESVIKIVHGKGKEAVLKTCVNGWLRQHEQVLAFTSAPAKDGGTGAVLVMLKRG